MAPAITGPAGYLEWTAPLPLRRYLACGWTGGLGPPRPEPAEPAEPVLPDGCMDVIWDGRRLFIAGADTAPKWGPAERAFCVGMRFRPGMCPLFLGVPASALRDQLVDLELLAPDAGEISEELAGSATLRQAAGVLEQWVLQRLPAVEEPDAVVEAGVRLWSRGGATVAPIRLAEWAGISERQLHRRFVASIGYGPKLLQRVLRFQAFLATCGSPGAGLAELALRAGYADQAHLSRETRVLAGRTPNQLRTTRLRV
ncbi:MAG: helix-turn-helix domain-containing protein [Candidatus Dormiibacterota bacterium]